MERRAIIFLGVLTAVIPLVVILWSHTAAWPEIFASRTDTFYPGGPNIIFNDFTPSFRTDIVRADEYGVRVRPITALPVYLLFQPRRHSKYIRVVIEGHGADNEDVEIGYRRDGPANGFYPENNIMQGATNEMHFLENGMREWENKFLFSDMLRERTDARRIVFRTVQATSTAPFFVRHVRLYYEDK